jgi:hypothetical protein
MLLLEWSNGLALARRGPLLLDHFPMVRGLIHDEGMRRVVAVYESFTYPEYVVPKSRPTISRSLGGGGSRIGPAIASVDEGGV